MVFTSLSFMFWILPVFLLCDIAARLIKGSRTRNLLLLGISLLFYAWGEAANVFILLGLAIINHIAGRLIHNSVHSRIFLIIFIVVNLAVLVGFKYSHWLASMLIPGILEKRASMPLGISFFTFHAISYLIDIYRKNIQPAKTALDFMTYFCMFPHLVAGPIVRYSQVQEDLAARGPHKDLFSFGMYRFLLGLNKKVIIANSVAYLADSAFAISGTGNLAGLDAWIGIIAYSIQIYFDFSAYSDMAIGLAAMAGFHFEENFNRPYSSLTIRDFWKRWHISLSSWLRDYVYIPLGGSRAGNITNYRNLLLVFLLCGLWHGANFTFIIWGLWHGLFLIIERLPLGSSIQKLPAAVCRCYAVLIVMVGWVFFRADNFNAAGTYLSEMFTTRMTPLTFTYHTVPLLALTVGVICCIIPDKWLPKPTSHTPGDFSTSLFCIQALLSIVSVVMLLTGARNPFIYFNF